MVIAHHSATYAAALRSVLEGFDDVFVEALVERADHAVAAAQLLNADLVLASHQLPDGGPAAIAFGLRQLQAPARVVGISSSVTTDTARQGASQGLVGTIASDASRCEWYAVISRRAETR